MRRLIRLEFSKAFRNKWYVIALLTAVGLGVASAIAGTMSAKAWLALKDGGSYEWIVLSTQGSYNNSLLLGSDVWREVFFLVLPLLVVIPYSCSLRTEIVDGCLNQVYVRAGRGKYLFAKALAVFCVAGSIVVLALVINFALVSCLLPAYQPEALDSLYNGVAPEEAFASLLYGTSPWLYLLVNTLVDAALLGSWAVLVLAASSVIDNRVALLAGAFLSVLAAAYLNSVVFGAIGTNGFAFGLIDLSRGVPAGSYHRLAFWLFAVLGLTLATGVGLLRLRRDGDVL